MRLLPLITRREGSPPPLPASGDMTVGANTPAARGPRRWTLREIIQGKPLGHPSHAMFVHFPVAFYIGALAFDMLSRLGNFPQAPIAATWLIIGAFAGSVFAMVTGFVDWWDMIPGSTKRRWATRHMLLQVGAAVFFIADFIVRWGERGQAEADILWIVLAAVGVGVLVVGQWIGGVLVYEMAMRVNTKSKTKGSETGC